MNKPFLLLLSIAVIYLGFRMGEGKFVQEPKPKRLEVHPERSFPVKEHLEVTFVVYASNQEAWCERCLGSIFSQDYESYRVIFIDDASSDQTYKIAKNFVMNAAQDGRVILMHQDEKLGPAASLYLAAQHCADREIVVFLEAKDWLTQEDIIFRINAAFQNPDVWLAASSALSYPAFQPTETEGLFAFYAALLKNLPLEKLFVDGRVSFTKDAYQLPLKEMAGGRIKTFTEPFVFANAAGFSPSQKEPKRVSHTACKPLAELPEKKEIPQKTDLIVFSYDRPLQLYAFLESAAEYLTGVSSISVIYRASDERYVDAYLEVQNAFPSAYWMRQSNTPHKDFKPLVLQALKGSSSPYITFAVDDIVIKDFIDASECIQLMEKTGAYGFYLRLGQHVNYCYMMDQPQKIPPHLPLSSGVLAWDFRAAEHDWAFANTLDMTIYRKDDLLPSFESLSYKHPNRLEQSWNTRPSANSIGLCFETSKIVNLPLNMVNPSDCRHSHFMTAEELLVKWKEGEKIDIDPLFRIENASPHIDYSPVFIKRG